MHGSDVNSFILTKLPHNSKSGFVLKQLKTLKTGKGNKWSLSGKLADTNSAYFFCNMYRRVTCIVNYIQFIPQKATTAFALGGGSVGGGGGG